MAVEELIDSFDEGVEGLFQAFKMYDEDSREVWDAKERIALQALWLACTLKNEVVESRYRRDHPDDDDYETLEDKEEEILKRLAKKKMKPAREDILHILGLITIDSELYEYVKVLLGKRVSSSLSEKQDNVENAQARKVVKLERGVKKGKSDKLRLEF